MADFESIVPINSMDAFVQARNEAQATASNLVTDENGQVSPAITTAQGSSLYSGVEQQTSSAQSSQAQTIQPRLEVTPILPDIAPNVLPENRKAISAYMEIEQFQSGATPPLNADPTTVPPPLNRGGLNVKA